MLAGSFIVIFGKRCGRAGVLCDVLGFEGLKAFQISDGRVACARLGVYWFAVVRGKQAVTKGDNGTYP